MSEVWVKAQQLESQHWIQKKEIISSDEYREVIKERSRKIEDWLLKHIEMNDHSNLLEIGGGATQLVDYFRKGKKFALDLLADMYKKEFSSILNPKVVWASAKAEEIPYNDEFFDIIISRNNLDYVDSVRKTLSEIKRVLKKEGVVYIGLNTFSGSLLIYKKIAIDEEHPFTFSPRSIKSFITDCGFKVIDGISDAPENMSHFSDKLASVSSHKAVMRNILLRLHCFYFSEFLLRK